MRIKQIPIYLLPHTCTLHKYIQENEYNIDYQESITLTRVRLLDYRHSVNNEENYISVGKMKLFYDMVNSQPRQIVFDLNDKIVFRGKEYIVYDVKIFHDYVDRPHHMEVMLS